MDHTDPLNVPGSPPHSGSADELAALLAEVADAISSARVQRGFSLEDAAAAASIAPERLSEAEDAKSALTSDELQRLADAYGISPSSFFGGRETPIAYLAGF